MKAPLADWLTSETPPAPKWLIPDILVEGAMVILAGDPGVGKSVLSYSIALSLSSGLPFFGRKLEPRRVLYFDEENSEQDLRAYLHTLWLGLSSPSPLAFVDRLHIEHFGLSRFPRPYDTMRALVQSFQPELIVLDTATPICRILDENSNSEASSAIRELRSVRAAAPPSCSMLILKHARLDTETGRRDIRGAKAWKGELDGVLFHTIAKGRPPKGKWRSTRLESGKVRAYGLREPLKISPLAVNGGYLLEAFPDPDEAYDNSDK